MDESIELHGSREPSAGMKKLEHQEWWANNVDVPYGTCWCGCGLLTPIANKTRNDRYHWVGFPVRYLHGHGGRRSEPNSEGNLRCLSCGEIKNADENFYPNGHRKNLPHARKYQTICKDCQRDKNRQRKYGLSSDLFEEMVLSQGGRCAICSEESVLVVDHSHVEDGSVRGLLCSSCNKGIGFLQDSPELLRFAARYLSESPVQVLDKGYIEIVDFMGGDLSVINSARVSFNRTAQFFEQGDNKLIAFLMKGRHGTPFESSVITFRVKAPIFVAREWMRHRIGSYNEWSGRYSVLEAEFYIPKQMRSQVGKPGAYTFEPLANEFDDRLARDAMLFACEGSFETYDYLLKVGVAKEVARMVLPVNTYTQFYWTVNARSLMNFLSLRNEANAMFEIREYAKAVEELWRSKMPLTHAAFIDNKRVAP